MRTLCGICKKKAQGVRNFLYRLLEQAYLRGMGPREFKRWRKSLSLNQKDAAEALGLKRRVVQYYEKGERDGKTVEIPLSIALACYALSQGVRSYNGPPEEKGLKRPAKGQKPAKDQKKGEALAPPSSVSLFEEEA